MSLKLYNSLSKTKETFQPIKTGHVGMYVCGPTVYDEPHIGHLRSAYAFEVLRRYLESDFNKLKVSFVRNVTDVDDKIIDKARTAGGDLNFGTASVSERYFTLYKDDLKKLGISEPSVEPRATAHIGEMIALISKLIEKGSAYASGGDVYFKVASFSSYGKLSHQQKDAMLQNVRVETNEKKNDALDFALWKQAKEGEPSWDSPWGKGRPGWHIECSAMSMKYLGESFDIHGGGLDLVFPHHENEIAQSEASTGKTFAKTWLHHGLVTVSEQKMSKSLKNYVTLGSLKGAWAVEDLKFLFLGTHYRMPLDFSEKALAQAHAVREKFHIFLEDAAKLEGVASKDGDIEKFDKGIREALDDDLNTPLALAALQGLMHYARKSGEPGVMKGVATELKRIWSIFALATPGTTGNAEIEALVKQREEAKKKKDFKTADAVRAKLTSMNVSISDNPDGTSSWRLN